MIIWIFFILMELYFLFNRSNLNLRFKDKDIEALSIFDLIYYISRLIFWVYVGVGVFTSNLFFIPISIFLLKIPLYHMNDKVYSIYNKISPYLLLAFYFIVVTDLYVKLF